MKGAMKVIIDLTCFPPPLLPTAAVSLALEFIRIYLFQDGALDSCKRDTSTLIGKQEYRYGCTYRVAGIQDRAHFFRYFFLVRIALSFSPFKFLLTGLSSFEVYIVCHMVKDVEEELECIASPDTQGRATGRRY